MCPNKHINCVVCSFFSTSTAPQRQFRLPHPRRPLLPVAAAAVSFIPTSQEFSSSCCCLTTTTQGQKFMRFVQFMRLLDLFNLWTV
ncbi:hypothetical protein Hanom_Chr15g01411711 [Helianthus anomalus]